MKIVLLLLVFVAGLAFAGVASSNDPPGRDPCSHGATGKECKPDPSTNGKDCDKHGKQGGVNEDHCKAATSTTTPTTTSTPSTTGVTTSQTTTSQSTTTSGSTTNRDVLIPSTTSTSTGGSSSTTTTLVSTPTTTASTTTPETATVTGPVVQAGKADNPSVKSKPARVHSRPASSEPLPYTGLPLWCFAALGLVLAGAGVALRRI